MNQVHSSSGGFKRGDMVRCLTDSDQLGLVRGQVYTVLQVETVKDGRQYVQVHEDLGCCMSAERFVPVDARSVAADTKLGRGEEKKGDQPSNIIYAAHRFLNRRNGSR